MVRELVIRQCRRALRPGLRKRWCFVSESAAGIIAPALYLILSKNSMLRDFFGVFAARAALLAALLLMLSACASGPRWTETQQAALEERVRQRWATLEERDFAATWEFNSPAYKAVFPRELYVLRFSYAIEWELTEIKLLNYDRHAAVASVVARVMSKPTKQTSAASMAVGTTISTVSERWIYADGEWWFSANY